MHAEMLDLCYRLTFVLVVFYRPQDTSEQLTVGEIHPNAHNVILWMGHNLMASMFTAYCIHSTMSMSLCLMTVYENMLNDWLVDLLSGVILLLLFFWTVYTGETQGVLRQAGGSM